MTADTCLWTWNGIGWTGAAYCPNSGESCPSPTTPGTYIGEQVSTVCS